MMPYGLPSFQGRSANKLPIFNGTFAGWNVGTFNGGQWSANSSIANPNGWPTLISSGESGAYLWVTRNQVTPLDMYTHIKITIKIVGYQEIPQPLSIVAWIPGLAPWDDGAYTQSIELSSPWYMQYPPINQTYKDVYVSLDDLRVKKGNNLQAFKLRTKFPRVMTWHIAEISLVDIETTVNPVGSPACWDTDHCLLTEEILQVPGTSSTPGTASGTTPNSGQTGPTTFGATNSNVGSNGDDVESGSTIPYVVSVLLLTLMYLFL